MSTAAKKLLHDVLALPEDEQRWVTERLLDCVPRDAEQLDRAWADEAVERLERLERAERDDAKLVPYEEVRAHVEAALRGK